MAPSRPRSFSVVVPARNEEGNLKACVQMLVRLLDEHFEDYEIIVCNDGSTDGTGPLADALAAQYPAVRVIHQSPSRGFAESYQRGLQLARCAYVGLIPGDNELLEESVAAICAHVGRADIVIPSIANQEVRPWLRRHISVNYTAVVNVLFRQRLRYFQGPCVYPTELARRLRISTRGFPFLTEMLVRALVAGYSSVEIPMYLTPRTYGKSRALSWINVRTTLKTLAILVRDVYIRRRPLA